MLTFYSRTNKFIRDKNILNQILIYLSKILFYHAN